jgi:hypothetical protein
MTFDPAMGLAYPQFIQTPQDLNHFNTNPSFHPTMAAAYPQYAQAPQDIDQFNTNRSLHPPMSSNYIQGVNMGFSPCGQDAPPLDGVQAYHNRRNNSR